MAKVIWKGHINFGLVNVPTRLYSATRSRKLDFHLIDRRDQSPVGYLKINKETGREVRPDEIARAVEHDGQTVVLEDEDFEKIDPKARRAIDIQHFVRAEQIDPAYFQRPYFLAPAEGAERSYVLLREVIRRTGRVGIAKLVLRRREHLAAVMAREDVLVVNLIRFADELRDPGQLDLPSQTPQQLGITTDHLEMASELVGRMTQDWRPEQYRDEYRKALGELIEERAQAQQEGAPRPADTSQPAPEPERTPPSDLEDTLRQSLDRSRQDRL